MTYQQLSLFEFQADVCASCGKDKNIVCNTCDKHNCPSVCRASKAKAQDCTNPLTMSLEALIVRQE
jgi:hypothetical protein